MGNIRKKCSPILANQREKFQQPKSRYIYFLNRCQSRCVYFFNVKITGRKSHHRMSRMSPTSSHNFGYGNIWHISFFLLFQFIRSRHQSKILVQDFWSVRYGNNNIEKTREQTKMSIFCICPADGYELQNVSFSLKCATV